MTQMTPIGAPARSEVLAFGRWLKCCVAAKSVGPEAHAMYAARHAHSEYTKAFEVRTIGDAINKAVTGPMTQSGSALNDYERLAGAWINHVYPRSVLGRLTGVRDAPMDIEIAGISSGVNFGWHGESNPIAVSALNLDLVKMRRLTVTTIAIISDELARNSTPKAETLVRNDMEQSAISALDRSFLDPSIAAVADVSPASVTNGISPIQNASPSAVSRAFEDALASLTTDLISPAIIMNPKVALGLIVAGGADRLFPDLKITGGDVWGIPAIISSSAPAATAVVIDAALLISGRDIPFFDVANSATVELTDSPDGTGQKVSLWQRNLVGLKMSLAANWQMGQPGGVAVITDLPEITS